MQSASFQPFAGSQSAGAEIQEGAQAASFVLITNESDPERKEGFVCTDGRSYRIGDFVRYRCAEIGMIDTFAEIVGLRLEKEPSVRLRIYLAPTDTPFTFTKRLGDVSVHVVWCGSAGLLRGVWRLGRREAVPWTSCAHSCARSCASRAWQLPLTWCRTSCWPFLRR
jgi:hypothetical protein